MLDQPVIALHGSYRNGNFGDWLLLRIMAEEIRALSPGARVVLPFGSEVDVRETTADGRGFRWSSRASHLVYGGGGYFGAPGHDELLWGLRNSLRHLPAWVLLNKLKGKPFLVSGVGVGPLRHPISVGLLGSILRAADHITVRDKESAEWTSEIGVPAQRVSIGCDWALSLLTESSTRCTKEHPVAAPQVIHVSRAMWASAKVQTLVKTVVCELRSAGHETWLALTDNLGDNILLTDQRLASIGLDTQAITKRVPFITVDKLLPVLRGARRVLTMKLHVGLTSTCLGARVFSLAAHPKIPRFYRQIGCGDACVEVWHNDFHPEQIGSKAATYLSEERGHIRPEVRQTISQKLDVNRTVLRRFLNPAPGFGPILGTQSKLF